MTWTLASPSIVDTTGGNTIRIAADATNVSMADVFINNSTTTPTYSLPIASVSQWSVTGASGDTLIVDYSNGSPFPQYGGVTFNGSASSNNNSLLIKDTSGNADNVMATTTQIIVNGQIIDYRNVPYFAVALRGQQNNLTINGTAVNTSVTNANFAGTAVTVANGGTMNLGGLSTTVNSITLTQGSIVNGTLLANTSETVQSGTISSALSGSAGLIKNSVGTVTLSGMNTYSGGTYVAAGTLIVTNSGAILSGSNLIVGSAIAFQTVAPASTSNSIAADEMSRASAGAVQSPAPSNSGSASPPVAPTFAARSVSASPAPNTADSGSITRPQMPGPRARVLQVLPFAGVAGAANYRVAESVSPSPAMPAATIPPRSSAVFVHAEAIDALMHRGFAPTAAAADWGRFLPAAWDQAQVGQFGPENPTMIARRLVLARYGR
jgi:autotransporter-associated beta strand protein